MRLAPAADSLNEASPRLRVALRNTLRAVPNCVGASYLSLISGDLLGCETSSDHHTELIELVAVAARDTLLGSSVSSIEDLLGRESDSVDEPATAFDEIVLLSEGLIHVSIRSPTLDGVLTTTSSDGSNLGMVISKTRAALPRVEIAV